MMAEAAPPLATVGVFAYLGRSTQEDDMDRFTDEELAQEHKRAMKLADLCNLHGYVDGMKAHRATADAIAQEQTERSRGR
jgi:predicted component of viral defense system (DUF524 family)